MSTFSKATIITLTLIMITAISGCRMSSEDLGREVMSSMQENFNTDSDLSRYELVVTEVTIVRSEGNTYKGLANVIYKGKENPLSLDVVYDGNSFMWEIKNGLEFLAFDIFEDIYTDAYEGAISEYSEIMRGFNDILLPSHPTTESRHERSFNIIPSHEAFLIQAGSFGQRVNAERLYEQLNSQGYSTHISYSADRQLYNIFLGPFDNSEAQRIAEETSGLIIRYDPDMIN